jgi:hypothetical protein
MIVFSAQPAYSTAGCANQTCSLGTGTYECTTSAGELCTNSGSSCTSSICGGNVLRGGLLPSMPLGVTPHPDAELAAVLARCSGSRSTGGTEPLRLRPALLDVSLSQNTNKGPADVATTMRLLMPSRNNPLMLMTADHGLEDAMTGGKVMSYTNKPIVSYRVGWVYSWESRTLVEQGKLVTVKGGIQPGFSSNVPAQHVLPSKGTQHPLAIGFFISEVHYSDGSLWKLDKRLIAIQPER